MSRLITTTYRPKTMAAPGVYPGPTTFIGGDETAGFYGEVLPSQLISGPDLATSIGLVGGINQHITDPWLKFSLNNKTLFVAKRPFRYSISWDNINNVGAIFGTTQVNIGGVLYKVRVLSGFNTDPHPNQTGHDIEITHGTEWNRLMYNVHQTVPGSQVGPNWAEYTDFQIHVGSGANSNGRYAHVQESLNETHSGRRGGGSISHAYSTLTTQGRKIDNGAIWGWRPVLEPV